MKTFVSVAVMAIVMISCGTSKYADADHTRNSSRSTSARSANSSGSISNTASAPASTQRLVTEAEKLIGSKYRYGGTSPSKGFDCSGFTSYVYDRVDVHLPRTSTDQSRTGTKVKFDQAEVGDLVFFGTGSRVTHVGIVVDRTRNSMEVIHSTSSAGVKRDEIFGSKYWNSRKLWAVKVSSE